MIGLLPAGGATDGRAVWQLGAPPTVLVAPAATRASFGQLVNATATIDQGSIGKSFLAATLDRTSLEGPIKRISIITVCRNAEASIAETMRSVLQQTAVLSGRVELEYLVHDGMSTDRTLEIVESLRTPVVKVVAEHDSGLYDALYRAMQRCTGDVVAYLNAGD